MQGVSAAQDQATKEQGRNGGFIIIFMGLLLGLFVGFIWFLLCGAGFLFVLAAYTPEKQPSPPEPSS